MARSKLGPSQGYGSLYQEWFEKPLPIGKQQLQATKWAVFQMLSCVKVSIDLLGSLKWQILKD